MPASWARSSRSFRRVSRTNPTRAATWNGCSGVSLNTIVAVELRHKSWSDEPRDTLKLLGDHGAAWAQIDEPKFRLSIRQNLLPNVRTFYYLRLHGRNAAQWWSHEKSEDRYNYLYSAKELEPIAEATREASREVKKAYLYANNHFSAEVGRQCRDPEAPARTGRFPVNTRRRWSSATRILNGSSRSCRVVVSPLGLRGRWQPEALHPTALSRIVFLRMSDCRI